MVAVNDNHIFSKALFVEMEISFLIFLFLSNILNQLFGIFVMQFCKIHQIVYFYITLQGTIYSKIV